MVDQVENCMIEGCTRSPSIAIELSGKVIYLCSSHFTQLVSRMARAAERRGLVSTRSLKVERINEKKVRVTIKRRRVRGSSGD